MHTCTPITCFMEKYIFFFWLLFISGATCIVAADGLIMLIIAFQSWMQENIHYATCPQQSPNTYTSAICFGSSTTQLVRLLIYLPVLSCLISDC